MKRLPLSSELVPLVLSGKKTSTVRLGRRDYSRGQAKIVSRDIEIPIEITDVSFTKVNSLDDEVAKSEGCGSLSDLLTILRRFYPELHGTNDVTVIRFRAL
jgi:hypothetical protein